MVSKLQNKEKIIIMIIQRQAIKLKKRSQIGKNKEIFKYKYNNIKFG